MAATAASSLSSDSDFKTGLISSTTVGFLSGDFEILRSEVVVCLFDLS